MASWAGTARVETPEVVRPRRRPAARSGAPRSRPFGGVVWIVVLAVLLAGVVAVNVAVLQLNLRLDELSRERVQLRADTNRLSSQLSSASANARIESQARTKLGLVRADPALTEHVQLVPAVSERSLQPPHPPSPRSLRARLRRHPRQGDLAAGRPGLDARADRGAPARADDGDPGRARHDLRPDGRAARDRRAGDHRVRRPAARQESEAGRARSGAGARRRLGDALSAARRPDAALRLREAEGRSCEGGRAGEAEAGRPRLLRRGAALLPAAGRRRARARLRRRRQRRARGARALARQATDRQAGEPDDRHRSRRAASSTSISTKPERAGHDVFLTIDHGIQANAESVLRETVKQLGRESRQRDRPRPAHRRRARDGRRARLRRQPLRVRAGRPSAQPCRSPTSTSPAPRSRW